MAQKTNVRTLKLKLNVVGTDRPATWRRIRQIANDAWRAANWIASAQYFNDTLVRRLYARRKLDPKDAEAVQQVEEEFKQFFGTKRQASSERDIKLEFPDLPPCVTNPLNQVVVASYKKEKGDLLMGNRSLRTYRQGMPIQTTKDSITFSPLDGTHRVTWKLGRKEAVEFDVYYGRDKGAFKLAVDRILAGDNDYGAPQVQLKDRDLFLLLPIREPARPLDLKEDLAVGVDLGLSIPAYAALSEGPARMAIGDRQDFLKTRLQMQSRRRRLQRSLVSAKGGHGRKRRMKGVDRVGQKERDFARSYNHMISRRILDFALRHRAGTIKLEMLEGFGRDESQQFVLRNWSFFELQQMIKDKAGRAGIRVLHIDPWRTSQACSECGHWEPDQRKSQSEFVCAKCGAYMNADHNAAVNIARSDRTVTKKEQCQIYLQKGDTEDNAADNLTAGPTAEG